MHLRFTLQALALTSLLYGAHAQVDPATNRLCNSATLCRECIISSPSCTWCADPNYNGTVRCYANSDPDFAGLCDPQFVQNPTGGSNNMAEPPLTGNTQISPSEVQVNVRPGQPIDFTLNIRPARNFPVDIYLLMDLSFSMADDLVSLQTLGVDLASAITGITNNFQVGFGSFVDKRLPPFVSTDEARQANPCLGDNNYPEGCVSTYSFRHVVSLTADNADFSNQVRAQIISGNQDSPEGGFDGFLQSVVCRNLVGWRNVSRKLLLYITDAGFHYAGDGLLGGVITPHDGACRTFDDPDGAEYDDWITLDYPSIGQIAQALRENDIIPIFAAEASALPVYQALVREIGEGAFSGTLARDSSNILELVRDSYNNISQRILFDPALVPGVSIDIQPVVCPGEVIDGVCSGVQIENNASFAVTVQLQECTPENSGTPIQIPVRVLGFGSFNIELNAICSCPCDTVTLENDPSCNSNGTLRCGQCDCNPGRFGDSCQCDATGQGGMQQMCPLGPTDLQCTGPERGTCVCGVCQCRRDQAGNFYIGTACECDVSSCPSSGGELCSGRGQCACDGCRCNIEPNTLQPYFGDACECSPDINCVDPNNATDVCNGRGTCNRGCNGGCICDPPYSGDFCERCTDEVCFDDPCPDNIVCAECALNIFNEFSANETVFFTDMSLESLPNETTFTFDSLSNTFRFSLPPGHCPDECTPVVIINGTDDVEYLIQDEMSFRCEIMRDCLYRYYVAVDETTLEFSDVHVEFRRVCPAAAAAPVAAWIIAIAILIALGILGVIALLLLKLLLFILDVIEVKKFEQELANTKYPKNQNPLYRSAAKDYQNPIYGQ